VGVVDEGVAGRAEQESGEAAAAAAADHDQSGGTGRVGEGLARVEAEHRPAFDAQLRVPLGAAGELLGQQPLRLVFGYASRLTATSSASTRAYPVLMRNRCATRSMLPTTRRLSAST